MSDHHIVLTIPGGAELAPEFHQRISDQMAEDWQFRTAQGFKTFANPVEDTVPDWIKRRDAKSNGSDTVDASTLRDSLCDRDASAEDFNAFLSTAAPHALTGANLSRLRAIFLVDAYGSMLQSSQKPQADREAVREASMVIRAALEALHLAKKLVVVEVLEKANLEASDAAPGRRISDGEPLSEGDSERLKTLLTNCRAVIANGEGSSAKKMIENRPGILKAAKAEVDEELFYKMTWRLAGVEVLDDEILNHFLTDYHNKDQTAYGSTTVANKDEIARMTALAKHISILDSTTLEDVFGLTAKRIKEATENGLLTRILVGMGVVKFNSLCSMHGGVEGVMKINESPFVSKISSESPHPVGHKENPEHIVLDLARFGMAGAKCGDSVSKSVFMSMW